jgi:hypothetical protein
MANSITELMSTDPLLLRDQDITTIIEHFRKTRITFTTTTRQTKNLAGAKKLGAAEAKAKNLGIDLGEIEL